MIFINVILLMHSNECLADTNVMEDYFVFYYGIS